MMRAKRVTTILLSSLALLLSVGQGTAQKQATAQATIPFGFWIAGNRLPAGDYQIEHIDSRAYILFRSTDGKIVQNAYTLPLDDNPAKATEGQLVFRIQDGKRYLYGGSGRMAGAC
ncbi:MAG TPA: hypothetical protein VMT53_27580 [Terriglobales bacterium]|nr:hypothetical protein [Terriglobales bacterium]